MQTQEARMCMDEDVWVSVLLEKFNAGAMHPCRMLEFDCSVGQSQYCEAGMDLDIIISSTKGTVKAWEAGRGNPQQCCRQ